MAIRELGTSEFLFGIHMSKKFGRLTQVSPIVNSKRKLCILLMGLSYCVVYQWQIQGGNSVFEESQNRHLNIVLKA